MTLNCCTVILLRVTVVTVVATILLLILPGLPPDEELTAFHIEPPKKLEGWMATNRILDKAELYYEGPSPDVIESLVVLDDDNIITGDQSGTIFRIVGKQKVVNITQLKFPCSGEQVDEHVETNRKKCAFPSGMRLDKEGNLLVMDAFGGMSKVNLETGEYENLISKWVPTEGKIGYIPEDVQMTKDGSIIYWTDGSTSGDGVEIQADFAGALMGQPNGRLLVYDPVKKTNKVLLDDINFSNGICLSHDEDVILVSEYGSAKVRRYYLKGEKKGQSDTFIDGLPGYPDNIRPNGRGGYYVAMFQPWNEEFSMGNHLYSPYPLLRKLIFRVRFLLLTIIRQVKMILPDNGHLLEVETFVKGFRPLINLMGGPKIAIVVELSKTGEIIGVFYGRNGDMYGLSQLSLGNKYAYLVGPLHNKVWRIEIKALKNH